MMRYLRCLLFVLFVLFLPAFAKHLTDGFRIAKLSLHFPYQKEWETSPSLELLKKLQEPFFYLGKGSQSYVFESKDKSMVIKLFRFSKPHTEEKIFTQLRAAHIAYQKAKEETGLLYVHLNQTENKLPILKIKDKLGRSYLLPLDQYRFALQKKAIPLKEGFERALHDPLLMKQRVDQFLSLLRSRIGKQIFNTDPSLFRNFGFLEDCAVEIDFGNYRSESSLSKKEELMRYSLSLQKWLEKKAPAWALYLEKEVQKID